MWKPSAGDRRYDRAYPNLVRAHQSNDSIFGLAIAVAAAQAELAGIVTTIVWRSNPGWQIAPPSGSPRDQAHRSSALGAGCRSRMPARIPLQRRRRPCPNLATIPLTLQGSQRACARSGAANPARLRSKCQDIANASDISPDRDGTMLKYPGLAAHLGAANELTTRDRDFVMRRDLKANGTRAVVVKSSPFRPRTDHQAKALQTRCQSGADTLVAVDRISPLASE